MENIIKKAIEGGYVCLQGEFWDKNDFNHALLDKNFWQSLGKSCGWKDGQHPHSGTTGYILWVDYALFFHKKNLMEGWDKAVEWLEELVGKE